MDKENIVEKLLNVDNGRFKKILEELKLNDMCCECYHFNPNIQDPGQGYRCRISGSCVAATLNSDLIKHLWESIK